MLVSDREVEESGIAWHSEELAESATTVTCAVNLTDVEILLVELVELVPDWSESLAVAAPWSEEIDHPWSIREELFSTLS